ncbi:unnamed protein product [Haemonchus placei]|uniref:Apple domain-containing protein n=1 Tax=Haemonchus placei TaxID=6290 RepID=A0A0N4WWI5_HAEPC|nr:unnamed protein product [Haemonchus placei]
MFECSRNCLHSADNECYSRSYIFTISRKETCIVSRLSGPVKRTEYVSVLMSMPFQGCGCVSDPTVIEWVAIRWIPVVIIVCAIGWGYYAYVVELCINTVDNNIQRVFYLFFFHVFLILFGVSYYRTIFSPLRLPPSIVSELSSFQAFSINYSLFTKRNLGTWLSFLRQYVIERVLDLNFEICKL